MSNKRRIEFCPELWPRQLMALISEATEILFGGASEGGKSHFVRIALCLWCLAIPNLQCVLIRKKYDDILKNHVEGPSGFKALLRELIEVKVVRVTDSGVRFANGSNIDFVHCQDERQFDSAQGVEKHVIVIDEATQIGERLIQFFRGWCRMDLKMQSELPEFIEYGDLKIPIRGRFPRIIYTANPIGKSVGWFRRNFVKARPTFAIEKVHGFLRQYIPSRATDNKSIDLEAHKGRLAAFGEALARALDEGDWDSPMGDFFRQYSETKHVLPDFRPPDWWFKYRCFDWGSAEPFCVLWICVADGTEFTALNGQTLWAQAGALIVYREWYGCNPEDPAKGLGMRNVDIAKETLRLSGNEDIFNLTITDSLPFQDRGNQGENGEKFTTADDFAKAGMPLVRGNCARIYGWKQLGDRLLGNERGPMVFLTESCRYTREYVPAIERDQTNPEDCVSDGEATHCCDTLRIGATTRPWVRTQPKEQVPLQAHHFRQTMTPEAILKQLSK